MTAVRRENTRPAGAPVAPTLFSPALLSQSPRPTDLTLEKLLAAPRSHANQVVVPGGMYHLVLLPAEGSVGPRKCTATEARIEPKGRGGSPSSLHHASHQLEVEPRLARHLDGLTPAEREGKGLALLTLAITSAGRPGLIGVEILQSYKARLKPAQASVKADIDYYTLVVTVEGPRPAKGDDQEWQKVGRMSAVLHDWRRQVNVLRMQKSNMDHAQFAVYANGVFQQAMQSVMSGLQGQAQARRGVGGR
jgi:hypothetical protein